MSRPFSRSKSKHSKMHSNKHFLKLYFPPVESWVLSLTELIRSRPPKSCDHLAGFCPLQGRRILAVPCSGEKSPETAALHLHTEGPREPVTVWLMCLVTLKPPTTLPLASVPPNMQSAKPIKTQWYHHAEISEQGEWRIRSRITYT